MLNQGLFLFEVDFHLYPDPDISLEIRELFDQRIDRRYWAMAQHGEIINVNRLYDFPKRNMVINTKDPQTIRSLNLMPRFFARSLSTEEKRTWRVEVYDHKYDETDWIVLIDDKVHLKLFAKFWQSHLATFKELILEIEKIQELSE